MISPAFFSLMEKRGISRKTARFYPEQITPAVMNSNRVDDVKDLIQFMTAWEGVLDGSRVPWEGDLGLVTVSDFRTAHHASVTGKEIKILCTASEMRRHVTSEAVRQMYLKEDMDNALLLLEYLDEQSCFQ